MKGRTPPDAHSGPSVRCPHTTCESLYLLSCDDGVRWEAWVYFDWNAEGRLTMAKLGQCVRLLGLQVIAMSAP